MKLNLKKTTLFILLTLLSINLSQAQEKATEEKSSEAPSNEVSREDWIQGMSSALPTIFCQKGQYFRECFKVTAERCEEVALSATRVCLEQNKEKFPATFKQPDDGKKWGGEVGGCAGRTFEITLKDQRLSNDRCNNPKNWVPKK